MTAIVVELPLRFPSPPSFSERADEADASADQPLSAAAICGMIARNADAVGMSTVPEVIVAVHCGLRVVGFSIVTDMCLPDALQPANVDQIVATANEAEPRLTKMVVRLLETACG